MEPIKLSGCMIFDGNGGLFSQELFENERIALKGLSNVYGIRIANEYINNKDCIIKKVTVEIKEVEE